jgi:hypothetical protein
MEELKKCTNCSRAPQPLSEFEGIRGPCSTCKKCREKNKKSDSDATRKEYHAQLNKEKNYSKTHRERKKNGDITKKEHNMEQTCEWIQTEQTKERLSQWKKLNVHDRLGGIKRTANAKKIEWRLTDEEAELMLKSPCVYCTRLDLNVRLNGIDRLNQQGNYTTENTVPCCWTCNFMKGCIDPKTFIEQCKKISECTYHFPEVPRQTNIRPRKSNAPQPPSGQNQPQTPSQ